MFRKVFDAACTASTGFLIFKTVIDQGVYIKTQIQHGEFISPTSFLLTVLALFPK